MARTPTRKHPEATAPVIPVEQIQRPLPRESKTRAAKILKNFSLSKFTDDSLPRNYVPTEKGKDPAAVQAAQRRMLERQVHALKDEGPENPGMTLALPKSMLKQVLPTAEKKGTVELADLLEVIKQRMTGTELYAKGNPTLSRLSGQLALQSQVQDIIRSIKHSRPTKQDAKK